jgi:hypothetical protein
MAILSGTAKSRGSRCARVSVATGPSLRTTWQLSASTCALMRVGTASSTRIALLCATNLVASVGRIGGIMVAHCEGKSAIFLLPKHLSGGDWWHGDCILVRLTICVHQYGAPVMQSGSARAMVLWWQMAIWCA